MQMFFPGRRLAGLPAWCWLLLPPLLVALLWMLGPPQELGEPPEAVEIFREPILFAHEGPSFRFVAFDQAQEVQSLWAVAPKVRRRAVTDLPVYYGVLPGFYRQAAHWDYQLEAVRFGEARQVAKAEPFWLPPEDLERLRPLAVVELNRRSGEQRWGDRLQKLLETGADRESFLCLQNVLLAAAWLAVVLAVVAIISMFIRPAGVAPPLEDSPGGRWG